MSIWAKYIALLSLKRSAAVAAEGKMLSVFVVHVLAQAAFASSPCPQLAETNCAIAFQTLNCIPTASDRSASLLPPASATSIRAQRDEFKKSLDRNISEMAEKKKLTNAPSFSQSVSKEVVERSNKIVESLRVDLERLGFETETVVQQSSYSYRDGVYFVTPPHNVLILKPGNAKGALARELRAYEIYVKQRIANLPSDSEVKSTGLPIRIDPMLAQVFRAQGSFSTDPKLGVGLGLSPSNFFESQDQAIDLVRHEKRHAKVFLDIVSGVKTPYRGRLVDRKDPLGQLGVYSNSFSFDEIEGFTANVTGFQAQLGRETRLFETEISGVTPDGARDRFEKFRSNVKDIQADAKAYTGRLEGLVKSALENSARIRSQVADPMVSPEKFRTRISFEKTTNFPGFTETAIHLEGDEKLEGRKLIVAIPNDVVKKGPSAIHQHVLNYLVELDSHLIDQLNEFNTRMNDINRDPLSRLPPSLRPAAQNPDSN